MGLYVCLYKFAFGYIKHGWKHAFLFIFEPYSLGEYQRKFKL